MGFERRAREDRRKAPRSGKYERRRNTCSGCQFYKPQGEVAGLCLKHQKLVRAEDFACVLFVSKIHPVD